MIEIILYNSGLTLLSGLSKSTLNHPTIRSDISKRNKSPSEILFDQALHQSAIAKEKIENLGRPEIVHHSLLSYLYSPVLHLWGSNISMRIHTTENKTFKIPNHWNAPISFFRFRGLMEQLLVKKKIKTNAGNIYLKSKSLKDILYQDKETTKKIALTRYGDQKTLVEFQTMIDSSLHNDSKTIFLIGGYQKGPNPPEIDPLIDKKISLSMEKLPSFKIISMIMSSLEFSKSFNDKFLEKG